MIAALPVAPRLPAPVMREWVCPACPQKGHRPKFLFRYKPIEGMVVEVGCPKCGARVTLAT